MALKSDPTTDPSLRSWAPGANDEGADFPIQNLPFGVFARRGGDEPGRVGVAIGTGVLDLHALHGFGLLEGLAAARGGALAQSSLNELMGLGAGARRELRARLSEILREDNGELRDDLQMRATALVPLDGVELLVPARIGDYTDFYASIHHATNVGSMFRPDNPLLPNYRWVPIGYHGRASTIVASGAPVRRPCGQTKADDAPAPVFGPSRLLDYELEVGAFVGQGNDIGGVIPIDEAGDRLFGLSIVNDWSARDLQKWEYQPLGPFLAKSFATSVSPWVVTMEALAPFRVEGPYRGEGDPAPLPYLTARDPMDAWALDLRLEVALTTEKMRAQGKGEFVVSRGSFRDMYWTVAQMLTHHASNGCAMRPGDMFASGTVSGVSKDSRGCLLERTWRGSEPLELPTGETRRFLEDGDEVIMRGWCERAGAKRIGFGECRGVILPAGAPA